jgi:hypothetical protein
METDFYLLFPVTDLGATCAGRVKDLVTPNISAERWIRYRVLLIKVFLFHEKIPTRIMVYFVNASAKMYTVNSITFRAHLLM